MDTVSLTYDEIAERLGISGASARNLVRRKRWARSVGNDGKARIAVPVDVVEGAASAPADPPAAVPTSGSAEGGAGAPFEVAMQLARLEAEVDGLRQVVEAERKRADLAEARAADLREDRDRWHQAAMRPWWKRLAG